MYKEKLHQSALQAQRLYGDKVGRQAAGIKGLLITEAKILTIIGNFELP